MFSFISIVDKLVDKVLLSPRDDWKLRFRVITLHQSDSQAGCELTVELLSSHFLCECVN